MHTRITAPTVLVHPAAKVPKRSSEGAGGHDIRCVAGLRVFRPLPIGTQCR